MIAYGARMPVQRKVFRIEQMGPVGTPATALDARHVPPAHRQEILAELKALRDLVEHRTTGAAGSANEDDAPISGNLHRLRQETNAIQCALNRTKQEIAALHAETCSTPEPARASRELNAVVQSTEQATQRILDAAESIEDAANSLSASLKHEQETALALDIQDNVLRIFEACNFQDLSGQRVTKVLATLQFIEERVACMVAIWGGIDAFDRHTAPACNVADHRTRLHGPKLAGDGGHASQDEIDVLFANG